MKIALVKQEVYQDLYVNAPTSSAADLLFSSLMRVGPIGLFTGCDANFLIVQEEDTPECRAWEQVIQHYPPEWFRELAYKPFAETQFPETKFFQPGSGKAHSDFSVECRSVDWSRYDVVISLNFAIPTSIVQQHREVLWCHMTGEANLWCDRPYYGYDVCLTQEARGIVARDLGTVDFPYTFAGSNCLETIMRAALGRDSQRRGIFAEVNSSEERPVRSAAHLQVLESTGHAIRLHQQNIRENLTELFDAKYFIKCGGRKIRGNSVIEAISCGAVVLMNPADLHHSQLLPPEAWIHSPEEAREKVAALDADPAACERLRALQRKLLDTFVVEMPLESLRNCLRAKRSGQRAPISLPPPPASERSVLYRAVSRIKRTLG
jgi:hypothetical protein